MATIYLTKDHDMLDDICYEHYGTEAAAVAVLEANPGLTDKGPVYPAGVKIILPPFRYPQKKTVRLWD